MSCRPLLALGALVCCLVTFDHVVAKDIYVNNATGDDRFDGTVERNLGGNQGPVRTINQAMKQATNGDCIVIADAGEPYRESISLYGNRNSGSTVLPFFIEGNGAIIDGTRAINPRLWRHVSGNLFRFRPNQITFQQLYSDGAPLTRIEIDELKPIIPQLKPGEWCVFKDSICFLVEKGKLPLHYDLSHTSEQTGLTLYSVRNVIITDLVVQGFRLDGINVHDLCDAVVLSGVTARGNARSGVSVGGSSRATLTGSVVGDNGAAQLRVEEQARLDVRETEIIDNTAPAWEIDGGQLTIDGKLISRDPTP